MGLKEDIEKDILNVFETDLADAVRVIQIYTVSSSTYDEDTMKNTQTEVSNDVIATKVEDKKGENIDDPSFSNTANFLIMDANRVLANIDFELEMKVVDGNDKYKIKGITQDPAKVSWNLLCRVWG